MGRLGRLEVILGPPGTGKTTRLLGVVEEALAAGVPASRVAFLAFTRKAAGEARARAVERFELSEDDLRWFRTIHSLAFRQTGSSGKQLLKREHLSEIAARAGFDFRGEDVAEREDDFLDMPFGVSADGMLFLDNLARVTERTLEDVWRARAETHETESHSLEDLEELSRALRDYKERAGLIDFTDALELFVSSGYPPSVDLLIVDEAQDLSRLQWRAVWKIATAAGRVVIAGDDDQAIFKWAGADVGAFQTLPGEFSTLDQSHRLSRAPFDLAAEIIDGVSTRRPKKFAPRDADGSVDFVDDEEEVPAGSGSWLFLARHGYQLAELERACRSRGWFYQIRGRWSNQTAAARAVLAWENLRRGRRVASRDAVEAVLAAGEDPRGLGDVPDEIGPESIDWLRFDAPWTERLTHLDPDDVEYLVQARRGGEAMARVDERGNLVPVEPRVKISTIHGAKGGQADGVYLQTDVSASTRAAFDADEDDERRVFYVGVTRTRDRLLIRRPTTRHAFEIEER